MNKKIIIVVCCSLFILLLGGCLLYKNPEIELAKLEQNLEKYGFKENNTHQYELIKEGLSQEDYLKSAVLEYTKRLSKYCHIQITEVTDEKLPNKLNDSIIYEIKEKEANKILDHIKKDSYVMCLDLSRQTVF